jgi:hypothetical protein
MPSVKTLRLKGADPMAHLRCTASPSWGSSAPFGRFLRGLPLAGREA